MRSSLLADHALDLVTRHPLAAAGLALLAGALSWVATRTRHVV